MCSAFFNQFLVNLKSILSNDVIHNLGKINPDNPPHTHPPPQPHRDGGGKKMVGEEEEEWKEVGKKEMVKQEKEKL